MRVHHLLTIGLLAFSISVNSEAADRKKPPAPQKKGAVKNDPNAGPRKKEINFEERVIEGLNNRGYESLTQTGTVDDPSKEKLYRKRAEFDDESKYLLREMEYLK